MNSFSRVLLFRFNCFKRNKEVLTAFDANRVSFHCIQKLNFCIKVNSKLQDDGFKSPVKQDGVKKHGSTNFNLKPFESEYSAPFEKFLCLVKDSQKDISKNCTHIINKMYTISHNASDCSRIHSDLQKFLTTKDFQNFCTALHRALPKMKPENFLAILKMEHLEVPVSSLLMREVLTLILDNINHYNAFEKIFIFLTISRPYFESSKEAKNLKEAFEVYFESALEEELKISKAVFLMTDFIQDNNLPVKAKVLFAKKILDDLFSKKIPLRYLSPYIEGIFIQPVPLFSRSEALEILNKCINFLPLEIAMYFVSTYKKIVEKNDFLYDEEFCNKILTLFGKDLFAHKFSVSKLISVAESFCLMGHLCDDFIKRSAEKSLIVNFRKFPRKTLLKMACVLMQTYVHERGIITAENWRAVKKELESYDFNQEDKFEIHSSILNFCECLTFLGCDTKNLFNSIFSTVRFTEGQLNISDEHCEPLLRLYHLAKAYCTDSSVTLPDEILQILLKNSAARNTSFPAGLIDFIGGKDYLLNNCTTSDKYFLHYAAVLGPDNKPIKLSPFKEKVIRASRTNEYIYNIEDIERPPDSKIVIFQKLTQNPIKFRNSPLTPGIVRLHLKSLESLNTDVVLLPENFGTLPLEISTEYLRTQLNEIIEKRN